MEKTPTRTFKQVLAEKAKKPEQKAPASTTRSLMLAGTLPRSSATTQQKTLINGYTKKHESTKPPARPKPA
jgi:hypothetical protein